MSAPNFFTELKRRNEGRISGRYLVARLFVQVTGTVLPILDVVNIR